MVAKSDPEGGNRAGGDTPRLDQQLCFAIYQAGHAFNRIYRPVLAELGLTYPQYLVMLVLWEQDGLTVKALGERLMLDSGTLTPLLKRLEGGGIIRRERDTADERQVRIHLSEKGEAMRLQVHCVSDAIGNALGHDAEGAAKLQQQLVRLREVLLAAGRDD